MGVYDSAMFCRFLSLLVCLAFSACKFWYTADHLRAGSTTYTGVDIFHPVDGKIHYPAKQSDGSLGTAYVIAPEVTYRAQPPCFEVPNVHSWGTWDVEGWPEVTDMRPTGRVVVARIGYFGFERIVPELPKGLLSAAAPTCKADRDSAPYIVCYWNPQSPPTDSLGKLAPKVEEPGAARRAFIGTCAYVVDPVLNTVTCVLSPVAVLAATPFVAVGGCVQQQQQAAPPMPAPAPAPESR